MTSSCIQELHVCTYTIQHNRAGGGAGGGGGERINSRGLSMYREQSLLFSLEWLVIFTKKKKIFMRLSPCSLYILVFLCSGGFNWSQIVDLPQKSSPQPPTQRLKRSHTINRCVTMGTRSWWICGQSVQPVEEELGERLGRNGRKAFYLECEPLCIDTAGFLVSSGRVTSPDVSRAIGEIHCQTICI